MLKGKQNELTIIFIERNVIWLLDVLIFFSVVPCQRNLYLSKHIPKDILKLVWVFKLQPYPAERFFLLYKDTNRAHTLFKAYIKVEEGQPYLAVPLSWLLSFKATEQL